MLSHTVLDMPEQGAVDPICLHLLHPIIIEGVCLELYSSLRYMFCLPFSLSRWSKYVVPFFDIGVFDLHHVTHLVNCSTGYWSLFLSSFSGSIFMIKPAGEEHLLMELP